jgi:uncharacterized protein DUF5985
VIASLYFLCFAISTTCAVLLLRAFVKSRIALLLWSGIGFTGIALNNLLLVVDNSIAADLSVWRSVPTLIGLIIFIWGLAGERAS